ncbi:DUF3159 domain-containing protein [Saccharopolyspora sp. NPDC002686]|uniref:DUF3159 domain-containing protein n=1 Tax=Saccharopolyspora sp. NPDC002686 TaxID=3154541 RepID=UPI00331E671A
MDREHPTDTEPGRATGRQRTVPDAAGNALLPLLGGRSSALDASLPPLGFGLGWLTSGHSIAVGAVVALTVSAAIAVWRLRTGSRPLAVLFSLLAVTLGAVVAARTGNAADFFLVRFGSNLLSMLGWILSIAVRWPLLGVIVGTALRQGARWRRDPDLLRAYSRASWVWVGQYALRLAVFLPLWWADAVAALSLAQLILTWPLVALCIAGSWWVLRSCLPADHPGIHATRPVEPRGAASIEN